MQCTYPPLKEVVHQTGISEHLTPGALGGSPNTRYMHSSQLRLAEGHEYLVLGRDVRGTLASPTDTAGTPDPSAFQGIIPHSPRLKWFSLKNRHTVLRAEPGSLFALPAWAGTQLCPEGWHQAQAWPFAHRPDLTLEPPAKPCGALSAFSQNAGDPKQDHKAPLHVPLLPSSLHCNYCQPC